MLIHLCQASYPLNRRAPPWRQTLNFQSIQTLIRNPSKECFLATFFILFPFSLQNLEKKKACFLKSGNGGQRQK